MLEMKNATWARNAHATVQNFSMVAADGKLTAICGRTGSGKTALVETLLGLRPLAKGYVSVDGELVTPATACFFRSRLAYVPQTLTAPGQLTPTQLLGMLKRQHRHRPGSGMPSRETVDTLWNTLQLDASLWHQLMYRLEPGVQKRILLSFALASDRSILVADDPTGQLSDAHARLVSGLLRARAQKGCTVLVATSHAELVGVADVLVSV